MNEMRSIVRVLTGYRASTRSPKCAVAALAVVVTIAAAESASAQTLTQAQRDSIARADSVYWRQVLARERALQSFTNDSLQSWTRQWMSAPVYFADGVEMSRDTREVLAFKGTILANNPATTLRLTGYADTTGSWQVNDAVGLQRAQAAKSVLVAAGASPHQIVIASAGETITALGRPTVLDRRVEAALVMNAEFVVAANAYNFVAKYGRPNLLDRPARDSVATVSLLYSTDRVATGLADADRFFGNDRALAVSLGLVQVSVPISRHRRGRVEQRGRWAWLRGIDERDSTRFFVLQRPDPLDAREWGDSLRAALDAAVERDVFVYVNGDNVSFRDAALKAAQLTVDLQLRSVPVIYSWPSYGETLSYVTDLDASRSTAPRLAQFLSDLARNSGARRVHVLAHSMGNRALLMAAAELRDVREPMLGQVILAAPDEDHEIFREHIEAVRRISSRVTLYASSRDKALLLAQKLRNGRPRAGQAGNNLVVVAGIETVDASDVDTDFLAHGYQGNSLQVLDDLRLLVNLGLPASDRLTKKRERNGRPYWYLPPRVDQ